MAGAASIPVEGWDFSRLDGRVTEQRPSWGCQRLREQRLKATRFLGSRGAVLVADPDEPPLPFAGTAFELVASRHPATIRWSEIARVLAPGGTYFAQHVGPATAWELGWSTSSVRSPQHSGSVLPTKRASKPEP